MINDITFGQFIDTNSKIHKLDPRTKLLLLIVFIVFIFVSNNFLSLGLTVVLVVAAMLLSKIPVKMYLRNIRSILPIIIITSLLNMFYSGGGKVLVDWWIFTITSAGISRSVFMTLRIVLLILISAVLSYTTSPTALTGAIESLLKPLKWIGLGNAVHTMAMVMTIALRFIPTLIEETQKIMNAQKARGADMETGGIIKRVKALLPILIPLLISSIRRAYELAEAMECRCYNGGTGRTKYKLMRYSHRDVVAAVVSTVVFAGVIVLNIYSGAIYSLIF
ncbi:MAG: energy-coupling factor transporter transmembrane protein EcfT [Ruminococcaceae bacterium]|nr:energy-coupling factor transporter transmembrane protein EcfT [Oscillospiraceae bacterium]